MNTRNKLLVTLVTSTCMTIFSNAHASAYAVSYDAITNFTLVGGALSSFTFSNDASFSSGSLNGSISNSSATDASASCIGSTCSPWNNSFATHGAGASPGYTYGDAAIISQVNPGPGAASSIGESSTFNGLGYSTGGNTLIGVLTLSSAGTLTFGFDAQAYLQTSIGVGDSASAVSNFSITLTNSSGNQVYSWAPTALNLAITGNNTYNLGLGNYSNISATLGSGNYTVNISMGNTANTTAVPEADTWAMLLAGMGLVGFAARRKLS